MKKKILRTVFSILFIWTGISAVEAGYIIPDKIEIPSDDILAEDANKEGSNASTHKVTFQNSATGKTTTRYYEDGYILSMADLADATTDNPNTMYVSGSQYLSWKAEGGTYAGRALSTHIEVTEDLLLKGTATAYTNTVSASCLGANNTSFSSRTEETYQTTTLQPTYEETLTYGSQFVGAPDNIIRLTSEGYNQSVELKFMAVTAEVGKKGTFGLRDNDLSFSKGRYYSTTCINQFGDERSDEKERGGTLNIKLSAESVDKDLPNGYPQSNNSQNKYESKNGDITLGLSNPEANSSEGGEVSLRTPYKYQNSSSDSGTFTYNSSKNSYSKNYCANKIILQNDVIFSSEIVIGGFTAFYANNLDFTQSGYQGYIAGTYCEIDLNGFDLIMTTDSSLVSYGSITDSSRFSGTSFDFDKNHGSLIMLSGSLLQSPFVIEDIYLPLSTPVPYFNNNSPFNFFRCPYLDCDTSFFPGSQFQGEYKIDLAGISSTSIGLGVQGIVKLIGQQSDSNCLLPLTTGKINRTVYYEDTFISYASNLYNQKIKYTLLNSELTFNKWSLPFKLDSISIDFQSNKYQFFVPFYYSISLVNSILNLNQELVFMTGSNLYVDQNSKIRLSYSSIIKSPKVTISNFFGTTTLCDEQQYQSVGGLTFLDTFYWNPFPTKIDDPIPLYDHRNNNLFDTNSALWNKLADTPAYCVFDGELELVVPNESVKQYHPFAFGGQIDFRNLKDFQDEVNQWNYSSLNSNGNQKKVQLYGNYFMMGPNSGTKGILSPSTNMAYYYMRGFYTPPLMDRSNRVLVNTKEESGTTFISSSPSWTYDSATGIVTTDDGYFAFIPDYSWSHTRNNHNGKYNFYCASYLDATANEPEDLSGSFKQVTPDDTNHCVLVQSEGNRKDLFYKGMFVNTNSGNGTVSGTTACVQLYRFIGDEIEGDDIRTSKFNLSFQNDQWTLVSRVVE